MREIPCSKCLKFPICRSLLLSIVKQRNGPLPSISWDPIIFGLGCKDLIKYFFSLVETISAEFYIDRRRIAAKNIISFFRRQGNVDNE